MLEGYTWYVIACEKGGRWYAYAERIGNSNNLVSVIRSAGGVRTMNATKTKREALALAEEWNNGWKEQGKLWPDATAI